jgi:hypothetical protein
MDFVVANGGADDLWFYLGNESGTFQLPRIIFANERFDACLPGSRDLRGKIFRQTIRLPRSSVKPPPFGMGI